MALTFLQNVRHVYSPKVTLLRLLRPYSRPQGVRRLVDALKYILLTQSSRPHSALSVYVLSSIHQMYPADSPCSALSMYVLSSFHRNAPCLLSYGLAPPSACMSSLPFIKMHFADPLAASHRHQYARPLVCSKSIPLNLLWPRSILSLYALLSIH